MFLYLYFQEHVVSKEQNWMSLKLKKVLHKLLLDILGIPGSWNFCNIYSEQLLRYSASYAKK
jgi:hypothetical protein